MSTLHLCFDGACWVLRGRVTDVAEVKLTLVEGATSMEPDVALRVDLPGNQHALAVIPLREFATACETMCARVNAVKAAAKAAAAPSKWGSN